MNPFPTFAFSKDSRVILDFLVEITRIILLALRSSMKLKFQFHVPYEIDLKFLVMFKEEHVIPSRQRDLLSYCIRNPVMPIYNYHYHHVVVLLLLLLFFFLLLFFKGHYRSCSSCSHSQPPRRSLFNIIPSFKNCLSAGYTIPANLMHGDLWYFQKVNF
jgi:hypothetical protein